MSQNAPTSPPRPKLPSLASPYKGLLPYTETDAQFFFGRETDTDIIAANLISSRLTLLYGPSGVGKSSVLRAGAVNTLQKRTRENIAERGEPEFIVVYFNNWRDDPLPALRAEITRVLGALKVKSQSPEPHGRLAETLEQWTQVFDGYLLIILDQFEEFFLYHAQAEGDHSFASEFARAVNRANLRVNFLLSFREDALAKLDFFQGRIPNLFKNYLRIRHLKLDAARDAITKPLGRYNTLHPNVPAVTVETGLIDSLLNQVQVGHVVLGEAGRGTITQENADAQIETPYLQLVLTRLWERERMGGSNVLQLATLKQLGGAEEIVRAHLQHAIDDLSVERQAIAASVFDRLVTPSGTKIAQTARDLARYARVPESALTEVLESLAGGQNRILRPVAPSPERPDEPRYEIFHDVLSDSILEWRAKYEKEQEQQILQSEIERKRNEQERERKLESEQLRARRAQIGLIGAAILVLVFVGLTVFSLQQRQGALNSANAAQTSEHVAQLSANAAQTSQHVAQLSANARATSEASALQQAQNAADVSQGLANSLSTAIAQNADPTKQALLQTAEAVGTSAAQVLPTAISTPAPQNTVSPPPTNIITQTIQPTAAPTKSPTGYIYSAPTLTGTCGRKLKPEDFILDISFSQGLKSDEAFDIRSRSPSKLNEPSWDGVAVIRESQHMIRSNKSTYLFIPNDSEHGAYNLTVAVIRPGIGQSFEQLSPESNTCVLIW